MRSRDLDGRPRRLLRAEWRRVRSRDDNSWEFALHRTCQFFKNFGTATQEVVTQLGRTPSFKNGGEEGGSPHMRLRPTDEHCRNLGNRPSVCKVDGRSCQKKLFIGRLSHRQGHRISVNKAVGESCPPLRLQSVERKRRTADARSTCSMGTPPTRTTRLSGSSADLPPLDTRPSSLYLKVHVTQTRKIPILEHTSCPIDDLPRRLLKKVAVELREILVNRIRRRIWPPIQLQFRVSKEHFRGHALPRPITSSYIGRGAPRS